jgi:hypothetical protein
MRDENGQKKRKKTMVSGQLYDPHPLEAPELKLNERRMWVFA